jgi:hypothetical protein
VASCLEPQRAHLLGLEPLQRLGGPGDHVEAQQLLFRRRQMAGLVGVHVDVLCADDLQARSADRHRLVLDHGPQPCRGRLRAHGRRPAHEDLQRALVGVLRVVGAQRVAARHTQQRVGVLLDRPHDEIDRLFGRQLAHRRVLHVLPRVSF